MLFAAAVMLRLTAQGVHIVTTVKTTVGVDLNFSGFLIIKLL